MNEPWLQTLGRREDLDGSSHVAFHAVGGENSG